MFHTHIVLIALGIVSYILYTKVPLDEEKNSVENESYEDSIARKMAETREQFEWILKYRRDEPQTQNLLKILHQIGMTEKEFIEVMPQLKYQVSDDIYENAKKTGTGYTKRTNDEMIKIIKSSMSHTSAVGKKMMKGALAMVRSLEGDITEDDKDWLKNLPKDE